MFEITKIRIKRLKNLVVYSLAIYGALTLLKGCENETEGYEIQNRSYVAGRIEYVVNQQENNGKTVPSLLEKQIKNIYMRQ